MKGLKEKYLRNNEKIVPESDTALDPRTAAHGQLSQTNFCGISGVEGRAKRVLANVRSEYDETYQKRNGETFHMPN